MLEIRELTRRFGENTAVDHVSFEVPAGLMTGFVGGNGAGKTTTMRMVMGVLGIDEGEVLWQGRPITRLDRRRIGYMPEERGLYPKQPILDQLVYIAQLKGMDRVAARTQVTELLERFGLGERTKDHLEKLSLGNQQRVQIIASVLPRRRRSCSTSPSRASTRGPSTRWSTCCASTPATACRSSSPATSSTSSSACATAWSCWPTDAGSPPGRWRSCATRGCRASASSSAATPVGSVTCAGSRSSTSRARPPWSRYAEDGAEQHLVAEATSRGDVHEFVRVRPALSEIYREATA